MTKSKLEKEADSFLWRLANRKYTIWRLIGTAVIIYSIGFVHGVFYR